VDEKLCIPRVVQIVHVGLDLHKNPVSWHLILLGSVSVANMGSRADKRDFAGTSDPKTFQRKVQIEKTAIETNYALKDIFIGFFF
jgi:hypothetical protein